MNCNEAMALLPTYSDGELDAVQSAAMEKHVLGCPECSAQRDALVALRDRIRSEAPYYTAPASLRERVRAAIARASEAQPAPRPTRGRWHWLSAGALAGSAVTVFAWFLGSAVLDWRVSTDLDAEVVANHARATLGNRMTDVSSSDRHTVKPWLSSRLDYSPPVQDFAPDGWPLVGGRLDYLGGQAVATLVYRYREHTIDVFVRPLSGGVVAPTPSLAARRGFNVAHATGAGMEWWGVSDVSADVLAALVARLAHGE
jgi:anti-sigma factor (TIGR02949 family)